MAEPVNEVAVVCGYHAHVYYDAGSKEAAARLREAIGDRFQVTLGRQERPGSRPITTPSLSTVSAISGHRRTDCSVKPGIGSHQFNSLALEQNIIRRPILRSTDRGGFQTCQERPVTDFWGQVLGRESAGVFPQRPAQLAIPDQGV